MHSGRQSEGVYKPIGALGETSELGGVPFLLQLTKPRIERNDMRHDNNLNPPIEIKFLTPAQTAEILGVSLKTLREATKRNEIPCLKFGSNIRYNSKAIFSLGS